MLRGIGWLSRMPEPFREAILAQAIWRIAEPNTEFIHQGDEEGGLYAIARGLVEVSFLNHPDTRLVTLAHAGFWGGYRPLIGRERFADMVARTEVLWMIVPKLSVRRLLCDKPEWWAHFVSLADDHFVACACALVDLTRHRSRDRAAVVLLRLAGIRHVSPAWLRELADIFVSQADVAAMAVMSRGTFNAVLAEFVADGLVEVSYRSIRLREPDKLRAMVDTETD